MAAGVDVTETTPDGETPLHVAGISGNVEVVRALIDAGAKLDSRVWSERGLHMTPLTWFVYGAHSDAVAVLVSAGASVNAIVHDEQRNRITALDIALQIKDDDVVATLLAAGARRYEDLNPLEVKANLPPSLISVMT